MEGSKQRVSAVLEGRTPDRPPLYDLIRNDAVISHFAQETLAVENAAEVVPRAFPPMLDATRAAIRLPERPRTELGEDGRKLVHRRWTTWRERRQYPSTQAYAEAHRINSDECFEWNEERQAELEEWIKTNRETEACLGATFFFWSAKATPGLMGIFGEVGLEQFCYYLADCPDAIADALERRAILGCQFIEHIPRGVLPVAVFLGDDIAFKGGPMCSPAWMRREYFPRFKRIVTAWHTRGVKVLFHSDGDLMPILDDLVDVGIDGLNPIEVMAGMDIAEIHRRHPHLFMTGGIDVSQLLPFGTPQQVRDATLRAIEDAGGRLMVGSTTEVHDGVPLGNFLAMREAALEYRY